MPKREKKPLEELSKEELIIKCLNQRANIQLLQIKQEKLERENVLYKEMYSNIPLSAKVKVAMQETMSYINEVERLKKEIRC